MSLLSLGAMVFWGMVLSLGYQLFLPFAEKVRGPLETFLLYSGAGMLCFLLTALFLYGVSSGEWGIYGFLALVLGFGVYYRFFRGWGRRFSVGAERFFSGLRRNSLRLGQKLTAAAVFPFGKIVDKGVLWAEKRESQKKKDEDHGISP